MFDRAIISPIVALYMRRVAERARAHPPVKMEVHVFAVTSRDVTPSRWKIAAQPGPPIGRNIGERPMAFLVSTQPPSAKIARPSCYYIFENL